MNLVASVLVVVSFVVLLYCLRLVEQAREVLVVSRNSLAVLTDSALSDEAKEKALQKSAIRLFYHLAFLLVGTAIALFSPIGAVWLLSRFGLVSLNAVLEILMRWDFIVVASVVSIGAWMALSKHNP